ncbi:MAG: asparagine synthetase B [Flavobacteriales bacterium]|nr:asparagine synthetase B [Flavobacteriales bacterium]
MLKKIITLSVFLFMNISYSASFILNPMGEDNQTNHLKAYGIAYWILQNDIEVDWLLNYQGGSFLIKNNSSIQEECIIRGVSFNILTNSKVAQIKSNIANPEVNQEIVRLEKAPKIAVYTPKGKQPWDDAVTLVLSYAEIPYEEIYDKEIIKNELFKYEWLHLHHEDFTGQYGKFYRNYRNAAWYMQQQKDAELSAKELGFNKVSALKLQVGKSIKEFIAGGGFLFTMCSGTDSYDIALSAENTDICEYMFDGDKADPSAQSKLEYKNTLAFKDFKLKSNPMEYEFSDIDGTMLHKLPENQDLFTLFDFSAKWDIVPTLLCQNHTRIIKGFMGQTTDFKSSLIKSNVLVMGESKVFGTARYIHGEYGKGQWTFYGGHDPEDYRHYVNDPPTDLNLYPNSPGYRLILNNILFPAAKKKKQKT